MTHPTNAFDCKGKPMMFGHPKAAKILNISDLVP